MENLTEQWTSRHSTSMQPKRPTTPNPPSIKHGPSPMAPRRPYSMPGTNTTVSPSTLMTVILPPSSPPGVTIITVLHLKVILHPAMSTHVVMMRSLLISRRRLNASMTPYCGPAALRRAFGRRSTGLTSVVTMASSSTKTSLYLQVRPLNLLGSR